jgi:cytochrome c biogenesis protein CcdA
LANLKDVFWYGKWFVMEVPFSRRARLKTIVQNITSPIWAFCVGIVVSLFLLPCTSWPYITILSYLSAEHIDKIRGLIYLLIYNIVFILPMVIITFLVSLWKAKTEHLAIMKDKYNWLIHLIVWLLMLGLWAYCLLTI